MNAEKIIYDRFIRPFENKTARHIGVEAELPIVNENKEDTDVKFVSSVSDYLEKHGFSCVLFGTGGEKLFMENKYGDCLSFDNSYNNFEFSLNHGENLCELYRRFEEYFELVAQYLKRENHALYGCGTNPNYKNISVNHVPFKTYDMVQKYLHTFKGEHCYTAFPAFMSSVQTHIDVEAKQLPRAYTFFAKTDFLRGLLFANSPDFDNTGVRIFRDCLWEKSGFGNCSHITGAVDAEFSNADDIVRFFMSKGMFNRIRNDRYEIFAPIPIKEYFENPKYNARPEDIECYLSFCNVEITARGTLEIRSDCAQREGSFFAPPAFNLGIFNRMDKAEKILNDFFAENNITASNSELRRIVATGDELSKIAPREKLAALCADMLATARESLCERDFGEEKLLENVQPIVTDGK